MKKYSVVPFRMSPEEKEMLKKLCEKDGSSMARWIRRAINKAYMDLKP